MAIAPQEPGVLNVSFNRGADWSLLIDFSDPASIVGYTFTSGLYSTITGSLVQAITCTVVDAGLGKVNLSLTSSQTAAMTAGTYDFRVSWGPSSRRVYEGYCEVLP
jgi:hypothetical protein